MLKKLAPPAPILQFSIKWAICWLGITAIPNLFFIPNGIDYSSGFIINSTYYLAAAIIGIFIFNLKEGLTNKISLNKQIAYIMFLFLIVLSLSEIVKYFWPIPSQQQTLIQQNKFYLAYFGRKNWISKFCEIIFQQTYILGFLLYLQKKGESKRNIVVHFSTFFGLIHIPLVLFFGINALYFILPSYVAGFLFSYLILNFKYGITWSFALHLNFYLMLGIYWRFFK